MDDKQECVRLLQRVSAGSKEAFDQFYQSHVAFVFQIAFKIVGDRIEAEDICHDVFIEVYRKADQYNPDKGSVTAWLAVKTRSRALDRVRKRKPVLMDKLEDLLSKQETSADQLVLSHLERESLISALQHIPIDQRKVIYGAYFQGKTHQEMADIMNKPLGSIKSLIRYGINNLRKQKSLLNWTQSNRGER